MKLLALLAPLALTGCVTTTGVNLCTGAEARRMVYTTAVTAVDRAIADGRIVSQEARTARDAAALALAILNRNCPAG